MPDSWVVINWDPPARELENIDFVAISGFSVLDENAPLTFYDDSGVRIPKRWSQVSRNKEIKKIVRKVAKAWEEDKANDRGKQDCDWEYGAVIVDRLNTVTVSFGLLMKPAKKKKSKENSLFA